MIKIPQICDILNSAAKYEWGQNNYGFNDDYIVTLNGKECPVRGCRVSAIPFNRPWPGKQRDISQTETAGFITFSADEKITVSVKSKREFKEAIIRPLSKKIKPETNGKEINFELSETGSYVLELDGESRALHIFYNEIKSYPEAEQATYYFGPGVHFPGVISLRDNDTVYIDEEAVVFGSIYSTGAKNARVFGGGILDNSSEERILSHCYENYTKGTFRIYNCQDIKIEDVIMLNSSTWVLSMFNCDNIVIDNIKIVGQWRYNTDGIDIVNTSNVLIKNSFIRSFDDSISIKGIYEYDKPIENITVDNCILWCGWGHACEAGIETCAPEYRNITFKNCNVIHTTAHALAVVNGNTAKMHDIFYENINVEFQKNTLPQILQESDNMEYDGYGKPSAKNIILISNERYPIILPDGTEKDCGYSEIFDVHFRNINVYTDSDSIKTRIQIKSEDESVIFKNISIDGLFLNGEKQESFDAFETDIDNCENLTLI